MTVTVRSGRSGDHPQLAALYAAAFPNEDLLPLVDAMLVSGDCLASLVAIEGGSVVGHVLLTGCSVPPDTRRLALLGPLAVLPASQRRGIGTALVHDALRRLAAANVTRIFVLGDPAYYGRFGFAPERDVEPALPVSPAWRIAWQSLSLPGVGAVPPGTLSVPSPWHDPSLWGP
ncbi:MAG: N-acetyltransferase [Roseomonas sp.]|nr:N-acetyltransferase [Roseomonas sp.]